MKTSHSLIAATILLVGTLFSNAAPAQTSPRERTSIDDNWRFTKGNRIHFDIEGPGEIVATDNGDASNLEPFPPTTARHSTANVW